jgi:hypothetical protein
MAAATIADLIVVEPKLGSIEITCACGVQTRNWMHISVKGAMVTTQPDRGPAEYIPAPLALDIMRCHKCYGDWLYKLIERQAELMRTVQAQSGG